MLARTLVAACLLAGALPGRPARGQPDQNPSFNLVNHGASPVRELYVTPAGDARWGANRLAGGTIAAGAIYPVRRREDGNCLFDIRAVFADGHTEDRRGLNTCTVDDVAVGRGADPASTTRKAANDPSFRLVNRGQRPIVEAYVTPAGTGRWGENQLGSTPLVPSTDRILHIQPQSPCLFDLRVVFADRKALERHHTDLCKLTDLPVP